METLLRTKRAAASFETNALVCFDVIAERRGVLGQGQLQPSTRKVYIYIYIRASGNMPLFFSIQSEKVTPQTVFVYNTFVAGVSRTAEAYIATTVKTGEGKVAERANRRHEPSSEARPRALY